MATITHHFLPEEAQFLATAFPAYLKTSGTSFPVSGLSYDATAATYEAAYWKFIATNYASGGTVTVYWYADTATSGNVVWETQISAITPNTDSQDIETDALAAVNSVTAAHLGTTGQRLHSHNITISNLDSLANGDYVTLRIARNTGVSDTMTGDAILVMATLSYSDI